MANDPLVYCQAGQTGITSHLEYLSRKPGYLQTLNRQRTPGESVVSYTKHAKYPTRKTRGERCQSGQKRDAGKRLVSAGPTS